MGVLNQGWRYEARVDPAGDGEALVDHLARRWTHSDRAAWAERARTGEVRVDGAAAEPGRPLRPGQRVTWDRPPWEEPEVPTGWRLLARDAHLLAVHKPPGLPTLPGGGYLAHTLLTLVRAAVPSAAPMHRLGRGTSGIVLFAVSQAAREAVPRAFRTPGVVTKVYRTRVQGRPEQDVFAVDAPIGPVPHALLGTVHGATPEGRPSSSRVRVLWRGETESLVEVAIATGRPHQIRIHLAAAGHPLVGDPLYGPGGVPVGRALPGDLGYRLHHGRLALPHPGGGEAVFEDPWPADLSVPGAS